MTFKSRIQDNLCSIMCTVVSISDHETKITSNMKEYYNSLCYNTTLDAGLLTEPRTEQSQ